MADVRSQDGTRLALSSWGPADAPVIVLVHGLGLSSESWGEVPALLSDRYRVVAYDLRGHAQSGDAPTADYRLAAHAQDLHAVLGAVVPDGDRAVVVGHSLGGGIILAHAVTCPDGDVAGAVFAGSGGSAVTVPGFPVRRAPGWAEARMRRGWLSLLRATARFGRRIRQLRPVGNWFVRKAAFADGDPEELVDRVRQSFLGSRPHALTATTLASISHDGTELAPTLSVPVIVVHGTVDAQVSEDDVRDLVEQLPDAELVDVPGAGHMLPLTHAGTVAEHVTRLADRVFQGSAGRPRPTG